MSDIRCQSSGIRRQHCWALASDWAAVHPGPYRLCRVSQSALNSREIVQNRGKSYQEVQSPKSRVQSRFVSARRACCQTLSHSVKVRRTRSRWIKVKKKSDTRSCVTQRLADGQIWPLKINNLRGQMESVGVKNWSAEHCLCGCVTRCFRLADRCACAPSPAKPGDLRNSKMRPLQIKDLRTPAQSSAVKSMEAPDVE